MADITTTVSHDQRRFRRVVAWLFWGALLFSFSVTPIALTGMVMVIAGCIRLTQQQPASWLGPASVLFAVVMLVGTALQPVIDHSLLEPVALVLGTVGIVVTTWRLAEVAQTFHVPLVWQRWQTAAKWQMTSAGTVALFLGVAAAAGALESDPDAVFDWAIDSAVGLMALTIVLAIGLLGSLFWLRAAWTTWATLD